MASSFSSTFSSEFVEALQNHTQRFKYAPDFDVIRSDEHIEIVCYGLHTFVHKTTSGYFALGKRNCTLEPGTMCTIFSGNLKLVNLEGVELNINQLALYICEFVGHPGCANIMLENNTDDVCCRGVQVY